MLPLASTIATGLFVALTSSGSIAQSATATSPGKTHSVVLDTLMQVGRHRLHFHVLKGHSPAILFESGGGDDWTEWQPVLEAVHRATGATLITYDRAGFGSSSLDSSRTSLPQQLADLKTGLRQLHLDQELLLVAHSFGGYFATLFASSYPKQVCGAVFIDATQVAFWTDGQLASFLAEYAPVKEKVHKDAPGRYWMYVDMPRTTQLMRQVRFPSAVPAVVLMAGRPPFATAGENTRWQQAQRHFVAQAPNRKLVLVPESGHYIMLDAPPTVIRTITQLYERVFKPTPPRK